MTPTGFTLKYQDAGNDSQTVPIEYLATIEGGKNVGNPVFSFKSHGPSELKIKFPAVTPDTVAQIPFESQVVLAYKGTNLFAGRRMSRTGQADVRQPFVEYSFQDAWYDLEHITFKQAWFYGAYQNCSFGLTYNPAVQQTPANGQTITFQYSQGQQQPVFARNSANLYNSQGQNIGIANISWLTNSTTQLTLSNVTLTFPTPSGGTKLAAMSLIYTYPDVVLYQYRPSDPYQNASQIIDWYITTGSQLCEILTFAIAQGVSLQFNATEIQNTLNIFAPWYPARALKCADAIKHCLRLHPDCFTEIDYSTTPPTFHVRKNLNGGVGAAMLVPVLLPYDSTSGGRRHIATSITPRPELVPSRIGIYYRITSNNKVLGFTADIYPANAPDGLRAFDYSIDLAGPNTTSSQARISSVSFNPGDLNWWLTKCATLKDSRIPIAGQTGAVSFASIQNITVTDDNNNAIDWANTYAYEFVSGTVDFWMSNISLVMATVGANFSYNVVDPVTGQISSLASQRKTTRVKLVNTPTVLQVYSQFTSTGEALQIGMAQAIYNALQPLQYNLDHTLFENPFSGVFIKPGLNNVNLSGGDPAWTAINATVQTSEYTVNSDANGNAFADVSIRCGPVQHLEAGQLVQLLNLFANRDIVKIDPWERITGVAGSNSTAPPTDHTAIENSDSGLPAQAYDSVQQTITGS